MFSWFLHDGSIKMTIEMWMWTYIKKKLVKMTCTSYHESRNSSHEQELRSIPCQPRNPNSKDCDSSSQSSSVPFPGFQQINGVLLYGTVWITVRSSPSIPSHAIKQRKMRVQSWRSVKMDLHPCMRRRSWGTETPSRDWLFTSLFLQRDERWFHVHGRREIKLSYVWCVFNQVGRKKGR